MNKKAFTLVELLGVIVIMGILSTLATMSIMKLMDNSKKNEYVSQVRQIAAQATYMYNQDKYSEYFEDLSTQTLQKKRISLDKVKGNSITTDPYGKDYDLYKSCVIFEGLGKYRTVKVYIKSCENNSSSTNCNGIISNNVKNIKESNVILDQNKIDLSSCN